VTEICAKKVDFFFAEANDSLFFSPVFYAPSNFHARSIYFLSQFCAILIFTRFLPYFRRQKNLTPAGGHVIDFYLSFPSRLIFTRFLPYFRRQKKPVPAGGSAIDLSLSIASCSI